MVAWNPPLELGRWIEQYYLTHTGGLESPLGARPADRAVLFDADGPLYYLAQRMERRNPVLELRRKEGRREGGEERT